MCITRQQVGIIVVVVGTVFLAFSVRVKRQYHGKAASDLDAIKQKNPDLIEPTETYINRYLFWAGLVLVASGSALQW